MGKLTKKKFEEFLRVAFKNSKPPEEMWANEHLIKEYSEAFVLYKIRKTDHGMVKLYKMK